MFNKLLLPSNIHIRNITFHISLVSKKDFLSISSNVLIERGYMLYLFRVSVKMNSTISKKHLFIYNVIDK